MAIQILLMLCWKYVDQPAQISTIKYIPVLHLPYIESACTFKSNGMIGGILTLTYDTLLLLNMVRLAIIGRNIPARFNDSKVMVLITYALAFIMLVILPALSFLSSIKTSYVIFSGGVLLASFVAAIGHTVPKIIQAFYKVHEQNTASALIMEHEKRVHIPTFCERCGHRIQIELPPAKTGNGNELSANIIQTGVSTTPFAKLDLPSSP
jgi:hypothetical protein